MQKTSLSLIVALSASLLFIPTPRASFAGLNAEEKVLWGASENAPEDFTIDPSQKFEVMSKAQQLISLWNGQDRYMHVQNMRLITDSLIETDVPTCIDDIGFSVSCIKVTDKVQVSVRTFWYSGNFITNHEQRKSAEKRAHLLAYQLKQYVDSLPAQPQDAQAAPLSNELELYLQLLRSQLAAKKFDSATSTLNGLKSAIDAASKGETDTKAVSAPVPTPVSPTLTKVAQEHS